VARDHADRGGEHGCIVGEAEHRQHVGHEVERQDEIGKRAQERDLDMPRRLAVERAIIGGEQIFGEGQLRHHLFELDPEPPAHAMKPKASLKSSKTKVRSIASRPLVSAQPDSSTKAAFRASADSRSTMLASIFHGNFTLTPAGALAIHAKIGLVTATSNHD